LRILVIGSGLMGSQIAVEYALAGHAVTLVGRDLAAAESRLSRALEDFRAHRGGSEQRIAAVTIPVRGWDEIALDDVELAVESVAEQLELKAELLGRVAAASPEAILATNTSSLRVSDLGDAVGAPERVIGTHYWNPPLLMPAVEVVSGKATRAAVRDRCVALLEEMGKVPIVVRRDVPGFVWNRLQAALLREAVWLVDEGVATPGMIDDAVRYGMAPRATHTGVFQTVELGGVETWNALMANVVPELSVEPEVGDLTARLESTEPERLERLKRRRDEGLGARLSQLEDD
jgi:3-hydroxybutyryl-CoA dehydrogenase